MYVIFWHLSKCLSYYDVLCGKLAQGATIRLVLFKERPSWDALAAHVELVHPILHQDVAVSYIDTYVYALASCVGCNNFIILQRLRMDMFW